MKSLVLFCSICGDNQSLVTDIESGEVACSKCGLVLSDKALESRAEWRAFDQDTNAHRSRAGPPSSLTHHDMGLSTVIGKENTDSSGRRFDTSMNRRIDRLRTWDLRLRIHGNGNRNLITAFSELGRLKGKLGLTDAVMEKTAYLYRKAEEKHLARGRSTSSILAAAVYAACRELGAPRTLTEIADATNIRRKSVSRGYRLLISELDIKMPLVDPLKCVAKIANGVQLSEKTKRVAMHTMNEVVKKGISAGKLPMGLAATVLYIACLLNGENMSQKKIADAAGVTEVTIRNRLKDLTSKLGLEQDNRIVYG
ncbi:MAG TPA: TFIIB-type zinc ribbon-containing protein [Nitrososphaera sp.]|nr:TFIIB-type zinc ribbon-containing protein [Nitrososphaera sp.]